MARNQVGDIMAGIIKGLPNDIDFFPGIPCSWGLGHLINTQPGPNGRSAGSLTWAGAQNTFYWIDPQTRVTAVFLAQILPPADPRALRVYGEFERGIYGALKAA
jgi:CubicO group peptidase (beta-lactamase class C family)